MIRNFDPLRPADDMGGGHHKVSLLSPQLRMQEKATALRRCAIRCAKARPAITGPGRQHLDDRLASVGIGSGSVVR